MYSVWVDSGRHTFLQYRDTGKTRHYVSMRDGSIDLVQMNRSEFIRLKPCASTPEHLASVYLKSFMSISRGARAILRGVLGESEDSAPAPSATSFTGGTVSLAQISEGRGWDLARARKFLRKLVDKPSGRWEWSPEEAQRIESILEECFDHGTKP